MKKRRRILSFALVAVVLSGLLWVMLSAGRTSEPVYEGKRLSIWLEEHWDGGGPLLSSPAARELRDVMTKIGTNAIPTLLQMIRAKDPPWKLKLIALAQRTHLIKINFASAELRNIVAADIFRWKLPTYDTNALPGYVLDDLAKTIEDNISSQSQWAAAKALSGFGPRVEAVVPVLVRVGTSTNTEQRRIVLLALQFASSKSAVPFLIASLQEPDTQIKLFALEALNSYSTNKSSWYYTKPAVPALVSALQDQEPMVRIVAESVLRKIDAKQLRTNSPPTIK